MYDNQAVQYTAFMQYDGSNGAAIYAAASGGQDGTWSYSEESGTLTITQDFGGGIYDEWSAPTDGYFLFRDDGTLAAGQSEADFNANMVKLAELANDAADVSTGIASFGALNGGASASVSVELKPGFTDSSYSVTALIVGNGALLANVEVFSTTIVDANTVTVVVKNTGLLQSNAGKVLVNAVKY